MINYIKAELYRNFNRKYFFGYTGVFVILAILVDVILFVMKGDVATDKVYQALTMILSVSIVSVPFIIIGFVDFITAEENKSDTVRNVLTFGLSRPKMVLSKIIATTILAFIAEVIILTVFFVLCFAFVGVNTNVLNAIGLGIQKMVIATPLWIASICLATLLAFVFKNNNVLTMVYTVIMIFDKIVVKIISEFFWSKFEVVGDILITNRLAVISQSSAKSDIIYAIVLGLIYIVLFTGAAIIYMNKKEIK